MTNSSPYACLSWCIPCLWAKQEAGAASKTAYHFNKFPFATMSLIYSPTEKQCCEFVIVSEVRLSLPLAILVSQTEMQLISPISVLPKISVAIFMVARCRLHYMLHWLLPYILCLLRYPRSLHSRSASILGKLFLPIC